MKTLVIAAHFDDEVLGCGGTIAKLTNEGHEVHVCVLTDSCTAQYRGKASDEMVKQKMAESEEVNKTLGIKNTHVSDFPDMKLDTIPHVELNREIEQHIRRIKPEVVYTHHWGDVNKDHRLVFESTMVAVRPVEHSSVKRVLCYEVPSATEWAAPTPGNIFAPNVFVDIGKTLDRKVAAMEMYRSEIRKYPHPRSVENITNQAFLRGSSVGLVAAESFMLIREVV